MGSKWKKAKQALGLNMCLYVPRTRDESPPAVASGGRRPSDASVSSASAGDSTTPTSSSSGFLRLPKSPNKWSSKNTCAICLTSVKTGQGQAIFTAECSHSFHFQCIASNVKHGNKICPICRSKWKDIPFPSPKSSLLSPRSRANRIGWPHDNALFSVFQRVPHPVPPPLPDANRPVPIPFHAPEPIVFNDDEALEHQNHVVERSTSVSKDSSEANAEEYLNVTMCPEVSAVSKSASYKDFAVLIHLKAPRSSSQVSRAPVDLVTVLDVSGSMAGTKLALLKRAMGFVIENLGPLDRLSVIAFSSTARRAFPLRQMNEAGKHDALQAVNSLVSNGGTNIAEGLRKGAKVILDRKFKNPVSSIILLSDGQDTYTVTNPGRAFIQTNHYKSLLPMSIQQSNGTGSLFPVHTFGFGADHDASSMHSIAELSGGTFSFIEAETVIQDAFAQCIGGLLSVVVQELHLEVDCVHPGLRINSIKTGSYKSSLNLDGRIGHICVGDLYAEEERDFLVTFDIPVDKSSDDMLLLKVRAHYRDPVKKRNVHAEEGDTIKILRPKVTERPAISIDVDRQRIRLKAAEAMSEARFLAERGDLTQAASVLETCQEDLTKSASAKARDSLYLSLCVELGEMRDRMVDQRVYETSGRAYVLSGLSSHSWQRATARGDFTDTTTQILQAYQTPSMIDMVTRSQTMVFGSPSSQRKLQHAHSFPTTPQPR